MLAALPLVRERVCDRFSQERVILCVTYSLICLMAPNLPNISYISSVDISNGRFLQQKVEHFTPKFIQTFTVCIIILPRFRVQVSVSVNIT